jgi:hypothetical protein
MRCAVELLLTVLMWQSVVAGQLELTELLF